MRRTRPMLTAILAMMTLATLLLAACSSPARPPEEPTELTRPASLEKFRVQFDDGFTLDYQIERQISKLNGRSCFAFISGTLHNQSSRTLSPKSVLDFIVTSHGKPLFRDITNPVSELDPGARAAFVMVVSPVHAEGCPPYDPIKVSLRKVFLD